MLYGHVVRIIYCQRKIVASGFIPSSASAGSRRAFERGGYSRQTHSS